MVDLELPTKPRQGGSLSLIATNISFTIENSNGATNAPAFDAPTAAWS